MASTTGTPRAVWAFTEHEHRELAHGLDRIHDVACGIGGWVEPDLAPLPHAPLTPGPESE